MLRTLFSGLAAIVLLSAPAAAMSCDDQGKPNYTAVRTLSQGGRTLSRSTVYFSSRWGEREERVLEGGVQDTVLILKDGTYTYRDGAPEGMFIPRPRTPAPRQREVVAVQEGSNIKYTELVPGSDGSTGVGEVLVCSPQGVPLRREYVAPTEDGRLMRFQMQLSNVKIQNLPRKLFKAPSDVKFVTPRQ